MTLLKSTIWYTAGNLFSRFIGFILLPVYSHLIPVEDFANYALIMSAYAVLAALYQGGILSGFTKYFMESKSESERKNIFGTVFLFISGSAFVLSIIMTSLAGDISLLITGSKHNRDLILIAVWMLFFDTLYMTILHLLKTREMPRKVVAVTSFSAVVNLVLNLYFIYMLHLSIKGILLAQFISGAFCFFILLPALKEYYLARFNSPVMKAVLIFSVPILAAGLLSTLVDVADRFILNSLMNKTAVGIYSFTYRIAMIMNLFVISYRTAWTPLSMRLYNNQNYSQYFGKSLNKLIGMLLLIFITVSLLIDDLFTLNISGTALFDPKYAAGLTIIPYILLGYAFSGIISFYSVYPYVSGKSSHFLVSDALCFIVNISANYLLIPIWGIMGAALATTLSFIAGAAYLWIVSSKIKIEYEYRDMFLIILGGVVFFAAGYYMNLLAVDILLILVYSSILAGVLKIKIFTNPFRA